MVNNIAINQAQTVSPPAVPVGGALPERDRHGIYLAWGVLTLIAITILIFLALLAWERLGSGSVTTRDSLRLLASLQAMKPELKADPASLQQIDVIITKVSDLVREEAEFWKSLAQMRLLNLLLPVLTAILGYVFGSRETERS